MRVYVTYDPDSVLYGGLHLAKDIERDFRRPGEPELAYPAHGIPHGVNPVGLDTEYDNSGALLTIGLAGKHLAAAIEIAATNSEAIVNRALSEVKIVVGHNVMGDLDQLLISRLAPEAIEDWLQGKRVFDSLLLARMVDEERGKGGYKLEILLTSEFNVKPWKAATDALFNKTPDAGQWPVELREERCRLDAWASRMLAEKYLPMLTTMPVRFIHRVAASLHRIGLAGASIDLNRFHQLGQEWTEEATRYSELIKRSAASLGMPDFSPTNDNHIRQLLYDKMQLEVISRTRKGNLASVDKTTLSLLKERMKESQVIDHLIKFNKADKLRSTWYGSEEEKANAKKSIKELLETANAPKDRGLLHFWINPIGARTGRRSSGGGDEDTPESRNSQNWPLIARSIVISRWPGGLIGAHDYASLEPILYSYIAKDENLFEYFYKGRGYVDIAKNVLGREVEKGTKDYKFVKSMTLGTFYNMGDWLMAKNLWEQGIRFSSDWDSHLNEVSEIRRRKFFPLFPGLRSYIRSQIRNVMANQQIVAPDGWVRHLPHHGPPDKHSTKAYKRYWGHIQNVAVNFPVQHLASMVTGSAIIDIERMLLSQYKISYQEWELLLLSKPWDLPCSVIINEVHDEVTIDYNPATREIDRDIVLECMSYVTSLRAILPDFKIKLKVESNISPAWGVKE